MLLYGQDSADAYNREISIGVGRDGEIKYITVREKKRVFYQVQIDSLNNYKIKHSFWNSY